MNRIGLVIGQLTRGGAERQLYELASRISEWDFEPIVYCLSDSRLPYGPAMESKGIEVKTFSRTTHYDLFRVARLRRTLLNDQVCLVHSWLLNDNAYSAAACWGRRLPWIASMRSRPFDRDWLRRRVDRWAFARADRVVVNSPEVSIHLREHYSVPQEKVSVIANGIDMDRLRPEKTSLEIRNELGISQDAFVILSAGRLEPVKNFSLLVRSIARLKATEKNIALWLVGRGSLRNALIEEAEQCGIGDKILFLDDVENIADLYHAADVFVLCSISEGLPNVVLEAMACRKPVLVSSGSSCSSVITNGEDGLISPEEKPEKYAEILKNLRLDAHGREKMGKKARETVQSRYSVDRMVAEMADLYGKMLQNQERRKLLR